MQNYRQRIAKLSSAKRKLLAERLHEIQNRPSTAPPQMVAYAVPQPGQSVGDDALRNHLRQRLPDYMVPHAVVLLDELPRTPNGKLDRRALPAPSATPHTGSLWATPVTPSENPIITTLKQIWADVLGFDEIDLHDNFFEVGGDSILSIQIVAKARQAGLALMPNDLFERQTVAELAAVVQPIQDAATTPQASDLVVGPIPLTPIQHWFFEQNLPDPHHWNQAVLVKMPPTLDVAQLDQALQTLYRHHDALRLRFTQEEDGWHQANADLAEPLSLAEVDLSRYAQNAQGEAIAARATELHASLDLAAGPLVRAALFKLGGGQPNRLLLVAHHLVIDGVSWQILLADLDRLCQQLLVEEELDLLPKTSSFQSWAAALEEYAITPQVQKTQTYWTTVPSMQMAKLSVDIDNDLEDGADGNTLASERMHTVLLDAGQTDTLLHEAPAAYHTQVMDILLTALLQTLSRWMDSNTVLIGLEGHGREAIAKDFDHSRTVGWFTAFYPAHLTLPDTTDSGVALKAIKEQVRQIPHRGIDYGVLRYLGYDRALRQVLRAQPQSEILFNYLGRIDQGEANWTVLQSAAEATGQARSSRGLRHHLLEINTFVAADQLQMNWSYSANLHHDTTIAHLADTTIESLGTLIAHCIAPTTGGYTPSDFPEAELDQDVLDSLLAHYGE